MPVTSIEEKKTLSNGSIIEFDAKFFHAGHTLEVATSVPEPPSDESSIELTISPSLE
jgi:hypothetical protein